MWQRWRGPTRAPEHAHVQFNKQKQLITTKKQLPGSKQNQSWGDRDQIVSKSFSQESSFSWNLKQDKDRSAPEPYSRTGGSRWRHLPAVDAGEEDRLSFICRSHLPSVVDHAFLIAASAASVNLQARQEANREALPRQRTLHCWADGCFYHRALQLWVLLILQSQQGLLSGVEDNPRLNFSSQELCRAKAAQLEDWTD